MRRHRNAVQFAFTLLALVGLTIAGLAKEQVPFKGRLEGSHIHKPIPGLPPSAFLDGSGTGNGTHLGKFSYLFPHTVNFSTGTATGTYTFTAANGDKVFAEFTGQSTPLEPGFVNVVELATITGGTGRFAGATGHFTVERVVNQVERTTTGTYSGTISSH